jgi:hypothetical protein
MSAIGSPACPPSKWQKTGLYCFVVSRTSCKTARAAPVIGTGTVLGECRSDSCDLTNKARADLWAQVLPNIKSHPDLVVANEGERAWVMRKNNPQLKALVDEFVAGHAVGTVFGITLLCRLQNTKWIKNSTSAEELQKFNSYEQFFRKYASENHFDHPMLAAQRS